MMSLTEVFDSINPFDTPPPFTICPSTPDDGYIFPIVMGQQPVLTERKDFVIVTGDSQLTDEVRYLVINSHIPSTVTLPPLRENRMITIHITTMNNGIEPCGHIIKPGSSSDTVQQQDSYIIHGKATLVSNKKVWYVF